MCYAAALLLLLGVSEEDVYQDYLLTNEQFLGALRVAQHLELLRHRLTLEHPGVVADLQLLGGNKAAAMFETGYRGIVSLPSSLTGYRQFFTSEKT